MIAHCREQQVIQGALEAGCIFKVPGAWGHSTHKRLYGRSGPQGRVVNSGIFDGNRSRPYTACVFKADVVIASLTERLIADFPAALMVQAHAKQHRMNFKAIAPDTADGQWQLKAWDRGKPEPMDDPNE
jgi:hypothetical protein